MKKQLEEIEKKYEGNTSTISAILAKVAFKAQSYFTVAKEGKEILRTVYCTLVIH